MLKSIKRLFTGSDVKSHSALRKAAQRSEWDATQTDEVTGDEVPRYPPFIRGLPNIPPERLIQTQAELVAEIGHVLAIERDELTDIIHPLIVNLAKFVHLLPASEAHHHKGAGGLFRHSLEAGLNAAKLAEGHIFAYGKTPGQRKLEEPCWRVAAFAAGMLHDVGKASTDMAITDEAGLHEWAPYMETLYDWTVNNKIDRYYIRWLSNRHKAHEQMGAMLTNIIITVEFKNWITRSDKEIFRMMLEAMSGRGDHPLCRIVNMSDSYSVEKDLRSSYSQGSQMSTGVPIERHIIDACRRLMSKGTWMVNEVGARVWTTSDGVFIAWKHAAEEIIQLLQEDRVPGVPRDPDTLADILIDRGLAVSNDQQEEHHYRYWKISPLVLETTRGAVWLKCLKFEDSDIFFNYEPPKKATILIDDGDEGTIRLPGNDGLAKHRNKSIEGPSIDDKVELKLVGGNQMDNTEPEKERPEAKEPRGSSRPSLPQATTAQDPTSERTAPVDETSQEDSTAQRDMASQSESDSREHEWLLSEQGKAAQHLQGVVEQITAGKLSRSNTIIKQDGAVLLLTTGPAWQRETQAGVVADMKHRGWVELDGDRPLIVSSNGNAPGYKLSASLAEALWNLTEKAEQESKSKKAPSKKRRKPARTQNHGEGTGSQVTDEELDLVNAVIQTLLSQQYSATSPGMIVTLRITLIYRQLPQLSPETIMAALGKLECVNKFERESNLLKVTK